MKSLYLIRHCSAEGQEVSATLTEAGHAQSVELVELLSRFEVEFVYCSQFLRSQQSMQPYCEAASIVATVDARLNECILGDAPDGDWQTALAESLEQPSLCFPGGESSGDALVRIQSCLTDVLSTHTTPVALCTHGFLLSILAKYCDPKADITFWRTLKNPDIFQLCIAESSWLLSRPAV